MKLLVCISFSPSSEHALHYALQFAAQIQADLTVLHVYPQKVDKLDYLPADLREPLIKEGEFTAQKHFLRYLKHLRAQVQEAVSVHPLLRMGKPEISIPEVAKEVGADMVLVGLSEKSRKSLRWKGGLMASLYQLAEAPILIIPQDATWRPIDHLVYGTRFDEETTRVPVVFSQLAKASGAHISCVNVSTPEERGKPFREPVLERMFRLDLDPSYQVCFYALFHRDPGRGLKAFAEMYRTDLLGLLYLRKKGFRKLFQRSLAKQLLQELAIPVLVVPQ